MLSQKDQKLRKGVQIPFLEKMLKENQKTLEQLDNSFDETTGKQHERLAVIEKISKAKSNITEIRKAIEYSKNIEFFRHQNIPQNIPDEHIWNDCWYDEKRNAFVTFNQRLERAPNARTRELQTRYDKEMSNIPTGLIIEKEKIQFKYGYPAILREDQDSNPVWFLLPTMTDDMLTKEIVTARLKPKTHEESVLYETESEQWITIGTRGLSLCERENEISDELKLYPPVPIEKLRELYGRK